MRYYVLHPGSPSFIWAEFATSAWESAWAEEDPENRRTGIGGPEPDSDDRS